MLDSCSTLQKFRLKIVNVWHQQIRVEFSSPYTTPKRSVNSLFYGSAYLLPQSYVCITWNEQSGHLLLGKFVQKTLLNIHQTLNKCTLGCKENNVKSRFRSTWNSLFYSCAKSGEFQVFAHQLSSYRVSRLLENEVLLTCKCDKFTRFIRCLSTVCKIRYLNFLDLLENEALFSTRKTFMGP